MAREGVIADRIVDDLLGVATGPVEDEDDDTPPYVLIGKASIPVPKKAGKRWEQSINEALTAFDSVRQSWNLSYTEYRRTADLGVSREGDPGETPNYFFENNTDENLSRENIKTILRNTYTRNPSTELTAVDPEDEAFGQVSSAVLNALMQRKTYPGINIKPKVRNWIVHAHLTNFGILKVDFQDTVGSRGEGQARLFELQEKLAKAEKSEEIDALYAELEELHETLPTMRDAGIRVSNLSAGDLVVDPDCRNLDLSDAKWVAEFQWISDAFIKQRYLEKDEEGQWVRKADGKRPGAGFGESGEDQKSVTDRVINQIIGDTPESIQEARQKGKTRCVQVWDKLTHQISLWIDGAWDYPLWVWEDDLQLSRFYPYFILAFTDPINSIVQEGEAAQYYGHTKEINKINKRLSLIRRVAFGQLIYNSRKIKPDQVEKIVRHMKNSDEFDAFGVDWDPEVKLREMFDLFVPPDAELQVLYDKTGLQKVVDRINSQSEIARGGQFKTNTTNKAVEAYSNIQAGVIGELTDAIEEAMEDVIHALLEIIVSKYTQEQIAQLVGLSMAEGWTPMSVQEFNSRYSLTIASGSTEKPTSENKKAQAIQLSQSIGQVGQATPMTTLKIMFRLFSKAFPDFIFTKEDEEMLMKEAEANLTKGVSTPGGAQPPAQPTTGA